MRHDGYYETVIISGSATVFIDGLPAARTGDAVDFGGVVIGSGTVNTG
ncbi:PAAR domain-containing protein [Salmonella enterica]|nr:PAAR domain-containing protein [Salmonella enterica]